MHDSPLFEQEQAWDDADLSEFTGIDPWAPSQAAPGSELKVLTLAARYAAGAALWHDEDCFDHSIAVDRPKVDNDYGFEPAGELKHEETDDADELELELV